MTDFRSIPSNNAIVGTDDFASDLFLFRGSQVGVGRYYVRQKHLRQGQSLHRSAVVDNLRQHSTIEESRRQEGDHQEGIGIVQSHL